jgi:hypothetical protein
MRQRTPVTALSYLSGMSTTGGTRLFTGGPAGRGLYQLGVVTGGGNGTAPGDLLLPPQVADIQTLAAARWTHVALVVDAGAATAEWFVDGAPVLRLQNVGPARIASNGEFLVGYQGAGNASSYDQDDYLLSRRPYTHGEIQALSTAPRAGDGNYMSGVVGQCGTAHLRTYGGPPVPGNMGYGLVLDSPAGGSFFLIMGYERCAYQQVPLPQALAPGCWLLTDVETVRGGSAYGSPVRLSLGVPPVASYLDLRVFAQAAVIDDTSATGVVTMHFSPGLAIAVGR